MRDGGNTFVARYPDGRRVTLRVKRDIEKLSDLDPGERLRAMLKMFPNSSTRKQLDDRETSEITGASYPRGRLFLDVLADLIDEDDDDALDRDRDLLGDDDDDDTFEKIFTGKAGGDDGGGGSASDHHASKIADLLVEAKSHPDRASALTYLLHNSHGQALLRRMHKGEKPMTSTPGEFAANVAKEYGVVPLAKHMVEKDKAFGLDEPTFTQLATEHAQRLYPNDRSDVAFSKLYQSEESVRRACVIAKAAEFSVFDIKPVVVSGTNARDVDNATAAVRAYEEIVRIGREKFPFLPADQQFARVFEDSKYAALAAQAHSRPAPTTIYRPPAAQGTAYTKSDPAPNADTAYGELMLKAQAYRDAHPELSIAQAFEKVFTAPANRELAKRERMESASR